jgi:hypothetical protein
MVWATGAHALARLFAAIGMIERSRQNRADADTVLEIGIIDARIIGKARHRRSSSRPATRPAQRQRARLRGPNEEPRSNACPRPLNARKTARKPTLKDGMTPRSGFTGNPKRG